MESASSTVKVPSLAASRAASIPGALSAAQMINMSVGFFGIQFAWAIQMGQMSGLYERLGAAAEQISWLWIAGPITGMLVQPIIGHMSDRTWGPLGRRRPYFLAGAILSSACLIAMPNSPTLWVAASLLWILDASINIAMEPFRALVADVTPEEQRGVAYSYQSFAIGLGSVLSFGIGGIQILDWLKGRGYAGLVDSIAGFCPTSLHALFYIGSVMFLGAILWTIATTDEPPPPDIAALKAKKGSAFDWFTETWRILFEMPENMRKLCLVHSLTWFGFFCLFIFFSPMVASKIWASVPNTPGYDEGIAWASLCYLALNVMCFASSLVLGWLTQRYSKKSVHAGALVLGGLALASMCFATGKYQVMAAMALLGIAWASTLSLPYALLSKSVPAERYGIFMGAFNVFICLPQIVCSLSVGPIVSALGGDKGIALFLGGVSMALGALALKRVKEAR